ncbi:conjugal transfer protein TrbL [Streptococcus sp. E17BB]|uniref:conjugal transfer protein TrbL n=1 Tax=Streptococcus sp. E17BB TaxID=3278714 RepID=UPI00359ECEBF
MVMLPFLANEKISAETLFEGFNVDLQSTADLVKNLANYNPTVWNFVSAITKQVMTPLAIAILTVLVVLEFSNAARKLSATDGGATFEFFAPLILRLIMVVILLPNAMNIIEAILEVGTHVISGAARIVSKGGMSYDTFSGFKGKGIVGNMLIGFIAILIFVCRLISVVIVNVLITMRFIQLYLMTPFTPLAIATLIHEEHRHIGIGFFKNVIAYAIQGVLIFLVVAFVSLFQNAANANATGVVQFIGAVTGSIVQAILLIVALIGTQRTARNIMGM